MEQLTFGACIKKGWISSWQAVTQMPWLFLGVCAVFACTSLLTAQRPSAAAGDIDTMTRVGHGLLSLVWLVLQLVVSGTLTIKVHRFVLLGEGAHPLVPLNGKPLGRYALVWLAVVLAMLAMAGLTYIAVRAFKMGFLVYVPLLLVYVFVLIRLSLLYPSIALGSRLTLRAAWQDSRGHVWSIIGVGFVTYLPLFIVTALFFIAAGPKILHAHQTQGIAVIAIVQALLNAVFIVFAAASLSWLYRRYARELLTHAENAPQ
ncbi:hypothetical protein R69927_06414 [Paraburkholderia domus]|jgi:hypothetical protein|uniref:Uncharacterized protein n=1 Tax=Paraburkholderia domus TaxID=2793075 RepID=A0A9N8R4S1_9BURK|nr:hypothetical protein [Paraburkholderia domus]MBK5053398.1 hypothetical protein [Burkholderia sp. R-70006]MBK5065256.1 hypothetical protein [Burkholderia sp. R-70199]MBK5090440.1 hypothetical protein [Burkholderia sp. R-69927]MBK5125243.1 hypothetical protein [Burkholderia sp. R-69980]MBK5169296.1 hypothetical protein [Burkholderia sp. R-70211]MBK5184561.1 hypothetical protein [Burkholderia sp. R-69749]MCI0150879.1 hypothetical protein [Paraburkholderia sediminicola]